MTAVAELRAASAPPRTARVVAQLTAIESRRLLLQPIFLAGLALSGLMAWSLRDGFGDAYMALVGFASLPLAGATLVVTNAAALRSRRHDTDEQYDALPAPPLARTTAHVLSVLAAVAAAVLLVACAFVLLDAGAGLRVDPFGVTRTPSVTELAQGPLVVGFFGVLGVAVARWAPHLVAGPVAVVAIYALEIPLALWSAPTYWRWLTPFAHPALPRDGEVSWPCGDGTWPCVYSGFAVEGMRWHLVYLGVASMLLAALALLRHGASRRLLCVAGAAAAATAGTFALQVGS